MTSIDSCPVCYERFVIDDPKLAPRQLHCSHILCSNCILAEIFESTFYCPECGAELKGTLETMSRAYSVGEESNEQPTNSPLGSDSLDDNNNSPKPRSLSLISQFSKDNPISPKSPSSPSTPSKIARTSDPFKYGECKEPSCQNKACAAHGYCLNHSRKKKLNVLEESKIADALAKTPLGFVSLEGKNLMLKDSTHIWPEVVPQELINRLRLQQRMEMGEAMELIERAKIIFSREPNVLPLKSPVVAVGDIHGQYYDLLNLLKVGGDPGEQDSYLFLGDYVDRGSFSCEVILTLLAYKVTYPDRSGLPHHLEVTCC
jgi:hypothetical protein